MHTLRPILLLSFFLCVLTGVRGQEEDPYIPYNVPSQNLLKFNRFLINPTFSTVREDKSYINLFHRNQSVSFDDNNQVYFLSYSGRVSDRSGVGLSLFTNREGLFNNFGVHANYAYGVRLGEKSAMTFGANFSYYQSAFNRDRANSIEEDPFLNTLESSSLVSFQPGINFSFGKFDIGGFAENLFDYNLKSSESITTFAEKTFSGHLQYTHEFEHGTGLMEQARLMPLARVRKVGEQKLTLGGNLILDLPKLGWIQAGYDDYYGASAGLGFNLTKNISLGYTVEKGLSNNFESFGLSHEISLAYSFTPNLTEDRVLFEDVDQVAQNGNPKKDSLNPTEKDLEIAMLEQKLAENDAILDELLMRQDSIETHRRDDLERRFESVMKMVRRETAGHNPQLEERARQLYFADMDTLEVVHTRKQPLANHGPSHTTASKKMIRLNESTSDANDRSASRAKRDNTYRSLTAENVHYKSHSVPKVESGHYLIANVFKGEKHTQAFMDQLAAQGVESDYFTNPRNGMNYVYVGEFQNKADAFQAHRSRMNGTYSGEVWVMNVNDGGDARTSLAMNTGKKQGSISKYGNDLLQKNVANPGKGSRSEIKMRSESSDGIASGFYIIAEVFKSSLAAKNFVKELNAQGLHASYFVNPNDNLRYVYLKKHETWGNALTSYYTRLGTSYKDEMWIMRIKPNQTV